MDKYGFPELAVANRILVNKMNYGESREELEKDWEGWIHHLPFDSAVSQTLERMYTQRLNKLNKETDAAAYQRLDRKLKLVRSRASRYNIARFTE